MLSLSTNPIEKSLTGILTRKAHWQVPIAIFCALWTSKVISLTLFHTLVELFSIGIALMSFIVVWGTYSFSHNRFALFLGCGYFWVGLIDLVHVLSFENLFVLPKLDSGSTVEFWIIARFVEALTLILAPLLFAKSQTSPSRIFILFGLISFLLGGSVFSNDFPTMYVEGQGLTTAKIISEYVIIGILGSAALIYYCKRRHLSKFNLKHLLISIGFTILAELSFTLYISFSDFAIVIGHFFKVLSFWAIYRVLVDTALRQPFSSLYRAAHSYDTVEDETVIVNTEGEIEYANLAVRNRLGDEAIGLNCHAALHPASVDPDHCPICEYIRNKQSVSALEVQDPDNHSWFEVTVAPIHSSSDYTVMMHSIRDITERKRKEEQFNTLNRLYSVLSHANQAIITHHTRNELFQSICDIAINQGQFKMAWIGMIDGKLVKPEYFAGEETGYLKQMQMRIDDSEWAQGPVGVSAKSKKVACVNSVTSDPNFEPWRKAAIERGYGSLAALPLILENEVIGIFTLYSQHENVFDDAMLSLLKSLTDDISVALYYMEQAKLKREAEINVQKLSSAVEQSANSVVITSPHGIIEYVNPGFMQLNGYSRDEIIGQNVSILLTDNEDRDALTREIWQTNMKGNNWRGEILNRKKNGEQYWSMQSISPIKNDEGEITHLVSTFSDHTRLHEAQETIQQLAFYDPLTKLANRRLLMDRLEHDLMSAKRHDELLSVMLCDLDNFKHINDSLGHDCGDQLLQHIAKVLSRNVREEDTVARLGGDEFVLVLAGGETGQHVAEIAQKILTDLDEPVELSGNMVSVSSSIGIAMYPQDGTEAKALMRNADLAMYHAKDGGKKNFQFFQDEMNERAMGRLALEQKLRNAVENNEFALVYQPQVNIANGKIIGLEALIRWTHPQEGMIPPDRFIPIAEETGIIAPIGDWVIEQAMRDWSGLIDQGYGDIKMSINVAAHQFRRWEHLFEKIKQTLASYPNCPPELFTVELTEGTLIDDIEQTIATLNTIKKLGVKFSIDDFGTGYSSLNYLKRFPIDQLKIDKSFVQDLLYDPNDEAITTAIIIIAKKLGINVVAEGIETREQSEFLLSQECEYAQGYLYHRPLAMEDLIEVLSKN